MEIVKPGEAVEHVNSASCSALEYPMQSKKMNFAIVTVKGRFPETGYAINDVCSELAYVQSGHGGITLKGGSRIEIGPGDVILIEPKDEYFWDGDLTLHISSTPAWSPDQHRTVAD